MRRPILSVSAALLALAACGRGDAPAVPAPGEPQVSAEQIESARFPQDYSDITVDPGVIYGRLDNGFRYAIMQNDTPSGTAAFRMRFDAGSLMERDEQRGLAHFLEHMAFNGSENVPEGEMIKILERHGLAFGADTNAYTSFGETVYMLDAPETDEDTLDTSFMLMDELHALLLDPEAIDRERGVVLSEMRTRNSPDYRASVEQLDFLLPDSLVADRMPIGVSEVLQTADQSLFRDLYERYYTPERAFFVAVGDFDPADIEQRIGEYFGDWEKPAEPGADPDLGAAGGQPVAVDFFTDPSIPTMIDINYITPADNLPDLESTRRDNMLRGLGMTMLTRRFAALARSEDAVFLQAAADTTEMEDVADISYVTIYSEPQNWQAALTLAENELRRAISFGFSEAELAEALANQRAAQENAAAQADTRQTPALANGVAGAFGDDMVFSHPRDSLERFNRYTEGLTVDEVNAAFRAAWEEAEPQIWMTSPQDIPDAAATILAAYEAAATVEVEAPAETAAADFAYADFGAPGEVAERNVVEDLGIAEIRFANNVMLNFKQTGFEQDVVRVSLRFGGGLLEIPADHPELSFVASNILAEGGTGRHSLDEMERILAGKTVSAGFGVDSDSFIAMSRTTPTDLETQLQIWAAYLSDAAYRPEAISQFRQLYAIQYPTMDATPGSVLARDLSRILSSGDPRFGYAPPEAVNALTADAARAHLERALANSAIEIGIVGDITEDEAVAMVARTFGALPPRALEPDAFEGARDVRFPAPTAAPVTLRHVGEADQAAALIYWPAPDGEDAVLARQMTVLSEVLQVRVTDKIREELGATYSPGVATSFSRDFPGYGYVGVRMEVRTEDVADAFAAAEELAAAFAAGDISQDDMDRAVRPILAGIDENQEQNPYWVSVVSEAQTHPENLDRHRSQRSDYEAVTLEDIKALAAQYLDPAQAVRIQVLPAERTADAAPGETAAP